MSSSAIQDLVAEKIKTLYSISQELEELFPGRHYTPDGHMIGSIGEALAACCYELKLFEASEKTYDGQAPDGRLVQIKATQISRIAISSEPEWLLVLKIHKDGTFFRGIQRARQTGLGSLRENAEKRSAPNLSGKASGTSNKSPAV